MEPTSYTAPAEIRKKYIMELLGSLFLTAVIGLVVYTIIQEYRTELDIKETSIEKTVLVTAKSKGGGKIPNMVYIKDGIIPIGVTAGTRWYWKCEVGKSAKVLFSLKHHAYQDPYRKPEKRIGFAYFFGAIGVFCLGRAIWVIKELTKPLAQE